MNDAEIHIDDSLDAQCPVESVESQDCESIESTTSQDSSIMPVNTTGWDAIPLQERIDRIRRAYIEGYITPEVLGSTLQGIYDSIPQADQGAVADIRKQFDIPVESQ